MSRVPELRGAHCTLHGSPSRESGTRVLAARGHTPGKWGRNPQLIHSTPVLTQFPLLKVSACEKGCQQDCGAHFGEDQDAERDVTAMDIGSGYRDVEALTLYCC